MNNSKFISYLLFMDYRKIVKLQLSQHKLLNLITKLLNITSICEDMNKTLKVK